MVKMLVTPLSPSIDSQVSYTNADAVRTTRDDLSYRQIKSPEERRVIEDQRLARRDE